MDHDPLLTVHAEVLGDPALFFVETLGPVVRVVEHATGLPRFVVDESGRLRPYATPGPSGQAVAADLDYRAGAAALSF